MLDSRNISPARPETGQDWIERLQWLGIKVEAPREKDKDQQTM
ncbi:hypothetical protein [Neomoorella thermoacetica]|nr:hypothetical protein [Moorella thermoacetica]APC07945.1 hypothetical protein MTJW_07750 [Moorella thermoacetica]